MSTTPYPPPPATPQPKKKMTTGKIVLIVCVVLALCCGGGAIAMMAGLVGAAKESSQTNATGKKPTAKVGQAAKDGQFEFTVTGVEYGKTTIGGNFSTAKAQGQYALVTVKVSNVGKEPRTLSGSNQNAYGPGGVKYKNDTGAEIYANEQSRTFLENINPGNSVTGVFVFDIPAGTKLEKIELHDGAFSGGVTVALA